MRWWQRRQTLKRARELAKATGKMLRMQRDLLPATQYADATAQAEKLHRAVRDRNADAAEALAEKLEKTLGQIFPRQPLAAWHENTEVLLVAVIVAMGIRTFFVQPFKIPTGSMQPTLYGIVPTANFDPQMSLLERAYNGLCLGAWPRRPSASLATGIMDFAGWVVLGQWPAGAIARSTGDHIFVDKISYHFRQPERGDVIVFETDEIKDIPTPSRGKFYIKRLVGLAGDTIQIKPPHVLVNGQILHARRAFDRIYSCENGYNGYVLPELFSVQTPPKYIGSEDAAYRVPEDSLFVLGDNSRSSLDGRFWGGLPRRALVGRALVVYWPLSRRFGPID